MHIHTEVARVRVICPECGAGGASSYPCWCHMCDYKVLMLPACNDHIMCSWSEWRNRNEHIRNE